MPNMTNATESTVSTSTLSHHDPFLIGAFTVYGRRGRHLLHNVTIAGVIEELRAAAEALNRGDPEPFVSLVDKDSEWRGLTRGHLWWKHSPACHGPDEAREMMRVLLRKASGFFPLSPEFVQIGDKIIGSTGSGRDGEQRRPERFIVFTVGDKKIVDMQGFASRRAAEKFANRGPTAAQQQL